MTFLWDQVLDKLRTKRTKRPGPVANLVSQGRWGQWGEIISMLKVE